MKKNLLLQFLIFLMMFDFMYAQTDARIAGVINSVRIDSLYENVGYLSGEREVFISSGKTFITSRYSANYGNLAAEEYLKSKLSNYGIATTVQYFGGSGGNIIGVQKGIKYPNKQIIICAHFDDMPGQGPAPGADDNGSGTSAVLEAARIISKLKTDYTIVYALWDNEELGLNGSSFYAQNASAKKDSIIAVINMDMIGWDGNNDFLAEIHTRNVSSSNKIASDMIKINDTYGIGLKLANVNPGIPYSDQSSFWTYNYSAILLIENYSLINGIRDFHPYYHTSNDLLSLINKSFYERCTKLVLGTLAYYSGIETTDDVKQILPKVFRLQQNYPNPFNPSTVIKYSIEKEAHVKLIVFDILGKEVATLVNEVKSPDDYEINFNGSDFTSGVFFYALYAGDHVNVRKMILAK